MASGSAVAAHTFVNDNGDSLTIDGRFEARYQDNGGDSEPVWNSGSSRFGLKGVKQSRQRLGRFRPRRVGLQLWF